LFNLGINEAPTTKCFFNENGDSIKVEPLAVFDFTRARMPSCFRPITNFMDEMRALGHTRFYIQRTYALGDVLTGVPVVRWLRSKGWDAFMRVTGSHAELMNLLGVPHVASHVRLDKPAPGLIADWLLERDHTDPRLGAFNRTHIYFKALGIDIPTEPLDWSCDLERWPQPTMELPERYVVMAGWGANSRKQLARTSIERVLKALNEQGTHVLYNGGPVNISADPHMTLQLAKRLSVPELFHVIARADTLITVDSGPLWIGHFTATPTIAVIGPSHWRQRCMLHPLWPEGVATIQMDEWAGCKSCTENGRQCAATYRCLHENADKLVSAVLDNVNRFKELRNGD